MMFFLSIADVDGKKSVSEMMFFLSYFTAKWKILNSQRDKSLWKYL